MKRLLKAGLLLFVILWANTSYSQNFEKFLQKVDKQYDKGNYSKAIKKNEKFKKKVQKKLSLDHPYMADYFINKAKISLAAGELATFNSDIISAIMISDQNNGRNSVRHAINLSKAAELYIQYGHFVKAMESIRIAEDILWQNEAYQGRFKIYNQYLKFRILINQGFNNDALAFADSLHQPMLDNMVTTDQVYNPQTNTFETGELPDHEIEKRKADYARLLILIAATYGNQGDFISADSAFTVADKYVTKQYGRNDPIYIDYQTERGKYELIQGDLKESRRYLQYAYRNAKNKYKSTHYLIFESQKNLIDNYLRSEKDSRAVNEIRSFYSNIRSNHSESSYYQIIGDLVNLRRDIGTLQMKTIYETAMKFLNNSYLPEYHSSRVDVYQFLYSLTALQNDYEKAGNYLNEIVKIRKELYGEEAPYYHFALLDFGNYLIRYTNDVDSAYNIYKNSYEGVIKENLSDTYLGLADIMRFSSMVHKEKDRIKEAVEAAELSVNTIERRYGNESREYGIARTSQVYIDIANSDFKTARKHIDQALDILKRERAADQIAFYTRALDTEAKLFNVLGYYDDAIKSIRRSNRLLKRATINAFEDFESQVTLAEVNLNLGLYKSTDKLLRETISSRQRLYGENTRFNIEPLLKLGDLNIIQGEYAEAEKLISEAQKISEDVYGRNSSYFAQGLIMRAKLNQAIGDNDQAERLISQALGLHRDIYGDESLEVANSLSLLGLINYYQGKDIEKIEQYFLEAEGIIIKLLGSENPTYAENLKNLGTIYLAKEDYTRALTLLEHSKRIWEANAGKRNNINTADIDMLIGDLHFMKYDYKNAEKYYKDAQKLFKRFFSDSHPKYVKTLSKLSKVSFMTNDEKGMKKNLDEALENYEIFIREYFTSLSEREKSKFWNSIKSDFEYFNTVALKLQHRYPEMIEKMYDNALLTKALLLNSSIKIRERILNSTDEELKVLYSNWMDKKELMTNALSMSEEELTEAELNPVSLKEEIENLERELSEKSEEFSQTFENKPVTWENVKQALDPHEVAVELIRFRVFDHVFTDSVLYAALYVDNEDKESKPGFFLFNDGEEMESKYFFGYRNSIRFKIRDELSYHRYWKPFEDQFGLTKTIYISPDGVFNQINLEAIPTPDGKYVLDNSNIILVNNTKDIYFRQVRSRIVQEEKLATLVGNPKFYASAEKKPATSTTMRGSVINDLPGTEKEVTELSKLLNNQGWLINDFMDEEATENNLKNIEDPKLFHIATHGFFTSDKAIKTELEGVSLSQYEAFENPLLRTGLMLKGAGDLLGATSFNYNIESGILTAYEAMNLQLDKTELVVLSACETGLGDIEIGEGVYGLQRAFLVAGAESIIMSLFKVSDEATQKLMVIFYEKWIASGDKRQAFIEAKKEIRTEYGDPLYWGSFVMIGLDY